MDRNPVDQDRIAPLGCRWFASIGGVRLHESETLTHGSRCDCRSHAQGPAYKNAQVRVAAAGGVVVANSPALEDGMLLR